MNVLVIGGGGREHAIITALAKSKKVDKLYAAPGNGGISKYAECFNVKATDIDGCVELAKKLRPDYVFVAPDDPLVMGMVDKLNAEGFKTFGPRANAAILFPFMLFSPIFSNYKIQKTGIVLYPCSLAFLLFVFVIEQIIECIGYLFKIVIAFDIEKLDAVLVFLIFIQENGFIFQGQQCDIFLIGNAIHRKHTKDATFHFCIIIQSEG